jgi:methyl-accepting chemotaxis protein
MAVVAGLGVWNSKQLGHDVNLAYEVRAPLLKGAFEIQSEVNGIMRYLWTAHSVDAEERPKFADKTWEAIQRLTAAAKSYEGLPKSPKAQTIVKEEILSQLDVVVANIKPLLDDLRKPTYVQSEGMETIVKTVRPAINHITDQANELLLITVQRNKEFHEESKQDVARAQMLMTALSLVFLVITGVFALRSANSIYRQLREVSQSLEQVGLEIHGACKLVADSSNRLAEANHEQSASVTETAAALEETTQMIEKNNHSAKATSEKSRTSLDQAQQGQSLMEKMRASMKEISHGSDRVLERVDVANTQLEEIAKVIAEIQSKTKVINDIVFQTKLLSFNASVESARAGEHGKGFSVVADEIGNLANMSGKAAKEISEMLAASTVRVNSIVEQTRSEVRSLVGEMHEKVREGSDVASECAESFAGIVTDITSVTSMAQEINVASEEQSKGVGEINAAVSQLEKVTQSNATASQQVAGAAHSLKDQADHLAKNVESLTDLMGEELKAAA